MCGALTCSRSTPEPRSSDMHRIDIEYAQR
jgi:hypothetical protein